MVIGFEEKKKEAVDRLRMLGIYKNNIAEFEEKGSIFSSDPPAGGLYRANETQLGFVREFEAETEALVYMIVRSYTAFGRMDCFLFVSNYPEEWEEERKSLESPSKGVLAYVYNYDAPECSEHGDIGLERTAAEGLIRIW